MVRVIRRLLDEGPIGAVVVGCAGFAVLLALVALLARRHRVARDLCSGIAAFAMAGGIASIVALYAATRRDLLSESPPWSMELLVRVETALFAAQVAALSVVVAAPLVAAAHALPKRETRFRWIAAGALGVLVAGFAFLDAHRVLENVSSEWVSPAARYAAVVDDCPRADGVRALVLVVGLALALGAAARRRHAIASTRRILGGAAWLAAGTLALIAAHPLGEDAERPVPFWDEEPLDSIVMPATLPPAPADCTSPPSYVTVTVGDRVFVDGRPTVSLASDLSAKRMIARSLHAQEPIIAVAAAPGVDVSEELSIARKLGFAHVATVAQRTTPDFVSASAGPIRRSPRVCLVEAP